MHACTARTTCTVPSPCTRRDVCLEREQRAPPLWAMDWCEGDSHQALAALDAAIEPAMLLSAPGGGRRPAREDVQHVRIECSSLAGASHHWLRVFKLEREYERAVIDAEISVAGGITVHTVTNIRLFEIVPPVNTWTLQLPVPLSPAASCHYMSLLVLS